MRKFEKIPSPVACDYVLLKKKVICFIKLIHKRFLKKKDNVTEFNAIHFAKSIVQEPKYDTS